MVASIFDGKRATNSGQKGWDIDVKGKRVQVKTHAKARHNTARWSAVNFDTLESVDELIIIVFTFDYKLKELIRVPWNDAKAIATLRGQKRPKWEISWNNLTAYQCDIDKLPRQDIIQMFR